MLIIFVSIWVYLVASPQPQSLCTWWTISMSQFCLHTHNLHLPIPSFMELCPQQKDQLIKYPRNFESEVYFTVKLEVLVIIVHSYCALSLERSSKLQRVWLRKSWKTVLFLFSIVYFIFPFPIVLFTL